VSDKVSDVQGFLFDLDGTLIDSMPHHHDAWVAWHARRGLAIDAEAFFAATAGRSNDEILADMFPAASAQERLAMAHEKEALYREIAAPRLALIPGAQAFVERSLAAGLRLAVCTASTPENMQLAFARFPIDRWVETVVSPADKASGPSPGRRPGEGLRGKPHPDIFLEAARRHGRGGADHHAAGRGLRRLPEPAGERARFQHARPLCPDERRPPCVKALHKRSGASTTRHRPTGSAASS
jgi:beta-phosphoglucomutase-like phosphatase (HAD superfamily)